MGAKKITKSTDKPKTKTSKTSMHKREQERTTHKKALFLKQFIDSVGIIYVAAKASGISERQVQTWRKEDKAFNQLFVEAEQACCGLVESEMVKQIKTGNTTLTIFYLVNRSKGRWENIQKIEHKADESSMSKMDQMLEKAAKIIGASK
jgi:ribosomal protein L17